MTRIIINVIEKGAKPVYGFWARRPRKSIYRYYRKRFRMWQINGEMNEFNSMYR